MASRDIKDLDKRIQERVRELLNTVIDGYEPFITDGYRSNEEQTKLYNQGRSTPGQIVTYAKAGQSPHNYGLAVDLAWRRPGTKEALWTLSLYKKLANKAAELGFEWGGSWTSFKDNPHYEIKNWRNYINNSDPIGGSMPSDGIKYENIEGFGPVDFDDKNQVQAFVDEYQKERERTFDCRNEKDDIQTKLDIYQSEYDKEVTDLKQTIEKTRTAANEYKKRYKEYLAKLSEKLQTTQDEPAQLSEVARLIAIEDDFRKTRFENEDLKMDLKAHKTANENLRKLNIDLKDELRVAKGLKDASDNEISKEYWNRKVEFLKEQINRLTNILRSK
jgi:mRNA-degrading endonuclease RelE of RelBE toxin-antitoxin system